MMEADFKRIVKINQKYKDIVNGYIKRVQAVFPSHIQYNISDHICHLILLFYYKIFRTNILSDTEQEQFLDLLRDNNKSIVDYPWKLIYDSTKDGLKSDTFVNKVYDHQYQRW